MIILSNVSIDILARNNMQFTYLLTYLQNFPSGTAADGKLCKMFVRQYCRTANYVVYPSGSSAVGSSAYITCRPAAGRIATAVKAARPVADGEMFTRSVRRLVYASSLVFVLNSICLPIYFLLPIHYH